MPHSGSHIIVTGSFDNWTQSLTLSPSSAGHSHTVAIPVEKTLFKFVVDGEWKVDESFATETDEHGNINNVLSLEMLEQLEGDDIQEITQDIPGAFPHEEGVRPRDEGPYSAEGVSHDLQPSHLDPVAQSKLENALESKQAAVESGELAPIAGINRDVRGQDDGAPGAPVAVLVDSSAPGTAPVDSSASEPLGGADTSPTDSVDPLSKMESPKSPKSPSAKSPNKHAIPVASYGFPEKTETAAETGPSAAHASIPAAAAAHALTMHDLQPSALDPHAAATLDQTISTKYSAVESGAISPVDSTGQSRAVPSTPTRGRHDSEYDHVTELRDEAYSDKGDAHTQQSRDKGKARAEGNPTAPSVVPPSPGIGSGFDEVKPKKKDVAFGEVSEVGGSRFHENETAPSSPTPMSPHLASLAQREGIPLEGDSAGVSASASPSFGSPAASTKGGVGVGGGAGAGASIPTASTLDPSTASSVHSAAATKSVAPGTPSSTALNLNVPVGGSEGATTDSSVGGAAPIAAGTTAASAAPATPVASAPVAPTADVVAAPATASTHASVASAPATAADVTITAGSSKKEKRRSIFRRFKDKMF